MLSDLSEIKLRQWIAACHVVVQGYKMSLAGIGPGYEESNYDCAFCLTADQKKIGFTTDFFQEQDTMPECNTCLWWYFENDVCFGNYGDKVAEKRIGTIEKEWIPKLMSEMHARRLEW